MSEHTTRQKIALITGANKGIGRAAAEQLAALGMTVPSWMCSCWGDRLNAGSGGRRPVG